MTASAQERALQDWLDRGLRQMGEIAVRDAPGGAFVLTHRDDAALNGVLRRNGPEEAAELARFDDTGQYRPLKTAPTLRHGWKLVLRDLAELRIALDHFYPGRLGVFLAAERRELRTTPLRDTLERQTGMYRIAMQITDPQIDDLVANFCRSDGGCLRTILWQREAVGAPASTKLPPGKFDPIADQTGRGEPVVPLLCQEACNLLVAEARKVVQESR